MNTDHYKHFCTVISKGPATDCIATIQMVMKLSSGSCDPNLISEWWNQWQMLKQAMKDNHPVVKLTAAMIGTAAPVPSPK
jgi:hypothetical protein